MQGYDNPTGLYHTEFTVPEDWRDRQVFVSFEGVESAFYLWVNGQEVILNLDYRQRGLGGASCGPGTLTQYLVQPGSFRFTVRLRPPTAQDNPARLSRYGFQGS